MDPTSRIVVEERIGDNESLPGRYRKSACAIKMASNALIERQIWSLKIVGEFEYVEQSVTCLRQNRL